MERIRKIRLSERKFYQKITDIYAAPTNFSKLRRKHRQEMEKKQLTNTAMAKKMNASRAALDRLLDPENESVTLLTMKKAASVLGPKLKLGLV